MGHPWDMGDLVAIDLPPGRQFLDELTRAWDSGHAVLPLQQEAPAALRRSVALQMGAARILHSGGEDPLPAGRPLDDEVALVVLTSGSTGEPKGVMLDHAAVEYSAFASATALGVDGDTHWVACLPLSHVGGLSVLTRAIHTGAELTILERFSPDGLLDALHRGATHVSLVATALGRIDPAPWKRILVGGSAVPSGLPENCVATYGMTETMGGVVYDGLALNGVEVRIEGAGADEEGREGTIQLRTPTLMRGYRHPEAGDRRSPAAAASPIDEHGWFTTGDLGTIRPGDRHLEVRGRADDLIITGGEKVWPAPVEQRILEHPAVAEVAVYGRTDPEWGQAVTALLVPGAGAAAPSTAEIREWVSEKLPRAACPREVRVVGTLPRTALGKIVRPRLVEIDPNDP